MQVIYSYTSHKVYIYITYLKYVSFEIATSRNFVVSFLSGQLKPKLFESSYQMNNLGGIEHTEIRVFGKDFTFNAEGIGERRAKDRTDEDNTLIRWATFTPKCTIPRECILCVDSGALTVE